MVTRLINAGLGQRRPATVGVAAGGAACRIRLAGGKDRVGVLATVLRADPIRLRGHHLAITTGTLAAPGHDLAVGGVLQRLVFRFQRLFMLQPDTSETAARRFAPYSPTPWCSPPLSRERHQCF